MTHVTWRRGLKVFALIFAAEASSLWSCSIFASQFQELYSVQWHQGIDKRLAVQAPGAQSIGIQSMPGFGGDLMRSCMSRSDNFDRVNGVPRAEVAFANFPRFAQDGDYRIDWSMRIPVDYKFDNLQPEIVMQIHQSSSVGSPPFSLILDGSKYRIQLRGGASQPVIDEKIGGAAVDLGKMTRWSLYYRPDDSGRLATTELYKNGDLVFRNVGHPNAYPGEKNAYLKLGVYKWWWLSRKSDVNERCMYYGNVDVWRRLAQ